MFFPYLHFPLCFSVAADIARLLSTDRTSSLLLEAAKDLLSHEQSAKRRKLLGDMLLVLEDRSEMESREDDQEWFQGEGPAYSLIVTLVISISRGVTIPGENLTSVKMTLNLVFVCTFLLFKIFF